MFGFGNVRPKAYMMGDVYLLCHLFSGPLWPSSFRGGAGAGAGGAAFFSSACFGPKRLRPSHLGQQKRPRGGAFGAAPTPSARGAERGPVNNLVRHHAHSVELVAPGGGC
jgi:hypothetical protein